MVYCTISSNLILGQHSGELIYLSKNKIDNYSIEQYSLKFDKNISTFNRIPKILNQSTSTYKNDSEDDMTINIINKYPDSLHPQYFVNASNKTVVFTKPITHDDYKTFENYTIEDKFDLNWVIHDEMQNISDLNCQRASLIFRGRNYTAWFSKNYNLPFGPFKFFGLPGIIVSIEDDLKEVSYSLQSIKLTDHELLEAYNSLQNRDLISMKTFNGLQKKAIVNSNDEFERQILTKLGRGSSITKVKTEDHSIELNFDDLD